MKKDLFAVILAVSCLFALSGCMAPQFKLFSDATDPLTEYRLSGEEEGKVLVIPIRGIISNIPDSDVFRTKPSMVQDVVSQLEMAESDDEVKAVVFKIESPGGSVTASDILYNEIVNFKKRTDAKVVAVMMNVAASGGYYISLPADLIVAHPTSVTGSIGVIFMRPKVMGLMDIIGVDVKVNTSGQNKDMGSPFRKDTDREDDIFQALTEKLGGRFVELVEKHRGISGDALGEVTSARIYLGEEAKAAGLVDEIGYLPDAVAKAKSIAGLPEDSKVVVYRRVEFANDNIYNSQQMQTAAGRMPILDLGIPESLKARHTGFYYLWLPGLDN